MYGLPFFLKLQVSPTAGTPESPVGWAPLGARLTPEAPENLIDGLLDLAPCRPALTRTSSLDRSRLLPAASWGDG